MSDLDYVYAVARIRVKEKYLLSDMDITQMVGLKDEKQVLGYLEDKGWGDSSSSGDADATAIKEICTSESNEEAFYPDEKYGRSEMLRILTEKDYKALPEHMRSAAATAMDVMLQTRDGQKCDIIVDRACLDAICAAGKRSKHALLRDYAESTVAVSDIKIAVRALRTGKSIGFLKDALAPCGSVDVRLLAIAASENEEALMSYLETHGFREGADALKESPSAFERWCDNRLIETIRPQKMNSVSMGPIIAYYLARQNEIRTVRIILTAKANDFPEEAIRERVREMYV